MNGNILRRRMAGGKKIEYEEYPECFKITVTVTNINQQFNIGYNLNGSAMIKIIIDGVNVTSDKNTYIFGIDPTWLAPKKLGTYDVYFQTNGWSGYVQAFKDYFRIPAHATDKIRTNNHGSNIKYIDCLGSTPPNLIDSLPNSIVQIRVPIGAKSAYDTATYWKDKKSKIVEYDFKIKS